MDSEIQPASLIGGLDSEGSKGNELCRSRLVSASLFDLAACKEDSPYRFDISYGMVSKENILIQRQRLKPIGKLSATIVFLDDKLSEHSRVSFHD